MEIMECQKVFDDLWERWTVLRRIMRRELPKHETTSFQRQSPNAIEKLRNYAHRYDKHKYLQTEQMLLSHIAAWRKIWRENQVFNARQRFEYAAARARKAQKVAEELQARLQLATSQAAGDSIAVATALHDHYWRSEEPLTIIKRVKEPKAYEVPELDHDEDEIDLATAEYDGEDLSEVDDENSSDDDSQTEEVDE